MRLLEIVTNEYITIVEYLLQNYDIENNRLILERETFKILLEKYGYMTFKEKCKIYKQLNFITHDKNNYTMPCRIDGKTERKVVLNFDTYLIIKELYNTIVEN
ncbi:hypothetical protein [Robinsoniella peoriensis]|uniref:TcpK family conjugal transfer DNA-binding protein n=1 Tax=Robinsoniella peoriensis TaxID=180332 RepID=UPI00374FE9D0